MDLLDFFDTATATMREVIAAMPPSALTATSGTGEWDGRQVLEHVLAVNGQAKATAAGVDVRVAGSTPDPLSEDLAAAYDQSASSTRDSLSVAGMQQRALLTPMGMFTGRVVLSVTSLENLVHAWDLSVAAGNAVQFDPVAVGYAFRAVEDMPDVWHNFRFWGAYAQPLDVPFGATPTARLLGLLGRNAQQPGQRAAPAGQDPRTQLRPSNAATSSGAR